MDPNRVLQEILELCRAVAAPRSHQSAAMAGDELAERVVELDEWIRSGGFLPRVWQNRPYPGYTLHEIRLVPKPKMDTPGAIGAVCRCGYESDADDQHGASKAGAQHLASKWEETQASKREEVQP